MRDLFRQIKERLLRLGAKKDFGAATSQDADAADGGGGAVADTDSAVPVGIEL